MDADPLPSHFFLQIVPHISSGSILFISLLLLLLLFLTALLAGSEVGLFSLNADQRALIREGETKSTQLLSKLLDSPQKL